MGCGNSTTRVKIEAERRPDRNSINKHKVTSSNLQTLETEKSGSNSPAKSSSKHSTNPIKAVDMMIEEISPKQSRHKKKVSHQANKVPEILPDHVKNLYKYHKNNYSSALMRAISKEIEYKETIKKLATYMKKRSSVIESLPDMFNFRSQSNVVHDPVMYKTLDNKKVNEINYSFKFIKKYYKKQTAPEPEEGLFTDNLFPPTYDSIIGMKNGQFVDQDPRRREKVKSSFFMKKEDIVWLRPKDIFTGGLYCLFANDISIDDVVQGSIGNCYFLSSMAALAEIPQLIYQLFKNYSVNEQGYYEIAVRIQGKWNIVVVDDFFPCNAKTKKPIFAKPREAEIWVMLLEKVWAKLNGGYLNTISGSSAHILSTFTSFSLSTLHHRKFLNGPKSESKIDELWNQIKTGEEVGYIMTCNSYDTKEIEQYGIISGHSFTLVHAKEAEISGKRVRLLNLRNPWGYKEWNGAWSDNSPEWTEEAKETLDIHDEVSDDGKFWICFEDFLKFFALTNICRVYSPQCCQHFSILKNVADLPHIFEIHIKTNTLFTISVFKKHWRFHRTLPSHAELQMNIIIVKKVENCQVEFIDSTHENEHDPGLEVTLQPGVYFVYVHANYKHSNFDKRRKYRILFTSNKFFSAIPKGRDNENFDFLRGIIISRVENKYLKESDDFSYFSNKFETTTYGIIYIANKTNDAYNIIGKNECENFDIISSKSVEDKFNICLAPGERLVIIGVRKIYYEMFYFKFDIEPVLVKNSIAPADRLNNVPISDYISECELIDTINDDEYDFVFKRVKLDLDKIITKINFIEYSLKYFISKYPEISFLIQNVPELNDGEEVIFQDLYTINEHTCYLGEWKVKQDMVKHGRGLCIFSDGAYYMGQFVNDQNNGYGVLQYPTKEKIEINWVDGKMHGKGKYYKEDGTYNEIEYEHGILVSKNEDEAK